MLQRKLSLSCLAALLLGTGALVGGCNSDDGVQISPVPAGYAALLRQQQYKEGAPREQTEGGRTVDELLAVVDGQYLTRREVLRTLRLTEADVQDDPDVEEEIRGARLEWAQQRLIMGAARRAGLRIPPSAIDNIVDQQLEAEMERNKEETGEELTAEEYLKQRRLTKEEYRSEIYGAVVAEYYTRKLIQGIGAARPDMDLKVDPSEVRRIYYDHRDKFDLPAGVKLALFQLPMESFETDGRDFLEAEEAAAAAAQNLAKGFKQGAEAKQLAEQFELPKANWRVTDDFVVRFPQEDAHKWLFDPKRTGRDVRVFRDPGGPIVLGVLDTRPEQQRDLSDPEVYDLIVDIVQGARRKHLQAKLTVDLLERGGVVWPDELADELLDQAQGDLDMIATHEIVKRARLR